MAFVKEKNNQLLLFTTFHYLISFFRMALDGGQLHLGRCLDLISKGQNEEIEQIALGLEMKPPILKLILGLVAKPFIEKPAESFAPHLQGVVWRKGYCPFCGSFPELSFLKVEEGQRWLRCSLCGHEWRFMRMVCPFCENIDRETMEFHYVGGRTYEGTEICHQCRRYLLSIDLRNT